MWFFSRNRAGTMQETDIPVEFVSLPKRELPQLAERYVKMLETQRTDDLCECEWIIHPDDTDKPKGKRRRIRGATSFECQIHTKEGFALGFVRWAMTQND